MELTRSEENRNRFISAGTALIVFGMLLLLLFLLQLVTPNPPFPEVGGGGGQELALGMVDVGTGELDYNDMGKAHSVETEKTPEEAILTDDNGEAVNIKETKPEEPKEEKVVIKPVKEVKEKPVKEPVKELSAAEKLAMKFKNKSGQNGGGVGNSDVAGQSGSPDGDPFKHGTGGSGTGDGGGNGPGTGPGSGPGSGGGPGGRIGIDLKGRAVVKPPKIPSDTKAEGKVVVEITVDSEGNVIEANPNGRGTTTSDVLLKAKARQAALATKFSVDGKFEEQRGTITIVFSYD